MQTCSCGKGCNSKYRCIRIHVRYTSNLGAEKTAVMYDDETTLGRQVRATALQCYFSFAFNFSFSFSFSFDFRFLS